MKEKVISVFLAITLLLSTAAIIAFATEGQLGDMDGNGEITAADARTILMASAKLEALDDEQAKRADTNKDGILTAADARLTLRVAAKLDTFTEETTDEQPSVTEPQEEESTDEQPPVTEPQEEESTDEQPPVTEPQPVSYPNAVQAFMDGKYYINGVVDTAESRAADSGQIAVKIAVDGSDFELIMEDTDPVYLSLAALKGRKYLKTVDATGKKMYTELTDDLAAFINMLLNTDIQFDSLISDVDLSKFAQPGEPETDGTTYLFKIGKSQIIFYVEQDDIKKIETIDAKGSKTTLVVSAMTSVIPSDMLTVNGFAEKTIFEIANAFE